MKKYFYQKLTTQDLKKLCLRQNSSSIEVFRTVRQIQKDVLKRRDACLSSLTKKFDGVQLKNFQVTKKEFQMADKKVSPRLKQAILVATQNIKKFHQTQLITEPIIEVNSGIFCWRENRAIEKVGLYIPAGTAPLFSTLLMLAIPAQIAGCKKIILCSPLFKQKVCPEIIWTANFLGLKEIYKIGGAQAIFAMAYGTNQIPQVDKVFGPGNQYVTAAKMLISQKVAIDMPAGPSEVLVIADKKSNAQFIASDLLSQAEHNKNSQVVLVANSKEKVTEILDSLITQLEKLPRKDIAQESLKKSFALIVNNLEQAIKFSNLYAPEHLILSLDDWKNIVPKIINAGSVFCGKYSSESFGDNASGTNHVLPTSGFSKSLSGVSVDSFIKKITFQKITTKGLKNLGNTVKIMAEEEKLIAHKNAICVRENFLEI